MIVVMLVVFLKEYEENIWDVCGRCSQLQKYDLVHPKMPAAISTSMETTVMWNDVSAKISNNVGAPVTKEVPLFPCIGLKTTLISNRMCFFFLPLISMKIYLCGLVQFDFKKVFGNSIQGVFTNIIRQYSVLWAFSIFFGLI